MRETALKKTQTQLILRLISFNEYLCAENLGGA